MEADPEAPHLRVEVAKAFRQAKSNIDSALTLLGEVEGIFAENGSRGLYALTGTQDDLTVAMKRMSEASSRLKRQLEG